MKIIFAGTPGIAAVVLKALLESEHEIVAVLTQTDRPAGRGQKLMMSPIKSLALEAGVVVHQPLNLNNSTIETELKKYHADLMIVVAYGLIIPQNILDIPHFGCWNVHVSLLPRWRGAAPIQRAIEAQDDETGITLMQMDAGLDTGPILLQDKLSLTPLMTSEMVHDLLAKKGAALLLQGLNLKKKNQLQAKSQSKNGITYAHKIKKTEANLDWTLPALILAAKIRAFEAWPVCCSFYHDKIIRIGFAHAVNLNEEKGEPGKIIYIKHQGIGIETGSGILEITKIQLPAAKMMDVSVFLNGRRDFFKENTFFRVI